MISPHHPHDDTGILDLRVYAHHSKKPRAQQVGTATLRMEDLREVLPMMTKRLRFEDQLVIVFKA